MFSPGVPQAAVVDNVLIYAAQGRIRFNVKLVRCSSTHRCQSLNY